VAGLGYWLVSGRYIGSPDGNVPAAEPKPSAEPAPPPSAAPTKPAADEA
jgi:hypothetical protein